MSPLVSVLATLARVFVVMLFSWLVAKGYITTDQANKATPELVSGIVLVVIWLLAAGHAEFQKYQAARAAKNKALASTTVTSPLKS
jgi:hypothetical protein